MLRPNLGVLVSLMMLAAASPAVAQDQPAGPDGNSIEEPAVDPEARARELYFDGDAHYAAGRYEKAVESFEAAYALSPKPLLKYNLANAYERMGEYEKAADALRVYLETPDARDVVSIRERLRRLDASADAERERRAEEARLKDELSRRATSEDEAAAEPADGRVSDPIPPAAVNPSAGISDRRPGRTTPWILTGVAAAGLGVGVATALISRSARNDAKDECATDGVCVRDAESEIDRHQRFALVADISFGVAIASAGVAAYLFLRRGPAKKADDAISVGVSGSRSSVGIEVSGAF